MANTGFMPPSMPSVPMEPRLKGRVGEVSSVPLPNAIDVICTLKAVAVPVLSIGMPVLSVNAFKNAVPGRPIASSTVPVLASAGGPPTSHAAPPAPAAKRASKPKRRPPHFIHRGWRKSD